MFLSLPILIYQNVLAILIGNYILNQLLNLHRSKSNSKRGHFHSELLYSHADKCSWFLSFLLPQRSEDVPKGTSVNSHMYNTNGPTYLEMPPTARPLWPPSLSIHHFPLVHCSLNPTCFFVPWAGGVRSTPQPHGIWTCCFFSVQCSFPRSPAPTHQTL